MRFFLFYTFIHKKKLITGGLVKDDFVTWDEEKYDFVKEVLWQEGGKFVGLDHAIPLGDNGITLKKAKGL